MSKKISKSLLMKIEFNASFFLLRFYDLILYRYRFHFRLIFTIFVARHKTSIWHDAGSSPWPNKKGLAKKIPKSTQCGADLTHFPRLAPSFHGICQSVGAPAWAHSAARRFSKRKPQSYLSRVKDHLSSPCHSKVSQVWRIDCCKCREWLSKILLWWSFIQW